MELADVMRELESMGSEQTRRIYARHRGGDANLFGVKVGDMKKIARKIGVDQRLAEELFATENGDAQYLAGLVADPQSMSAAELRRWARAARWSMAADACASVAAESPHGWKLALRWIDAKSVHVAAIGWSTLSHVVSIRPDDELDLPRIESLLGRIGETIHDRPDRVRYSMNGFVIAVGCCVAPLSDAARDIAVAAGKLDIDVGETSCKVPFAPAYIDKVVSMGRLGRKRRSARC